MFMFKLGFASFLCCSELHIPYLLSICRVFQIRYKKFWDAHSLNAVQSSNIEHVLRIAILSPSSFRLSLHRHFSAVPQALALSSITNNNVEVAEGVKLVWWIRRLQQCLHEHLGGMPDNPGN